MSSQIFCSDLEFVLKYLEFHSIRERKIYVTKANCLIYFLRWNVELKFEYNPTITAILDQVLSCNDNQDKEG